MNTVKSYLLSLNEIETQPKSNSNLSPANKNKLCFHMKY